MPNRAGEVAALRADICGVPTELKIIVHSQTIPSGTEPTAGSRLSPNDASRSVRAVSRSLVAANSSYTDRRRADAVNCTLIKTADYAPASSPYASADLF